MTTDLHLINQETKSSRCQVVLYLIKTQICADFFLKHFFFLHPFLVVNYCQVVLYLMVTPPDHKITRDLFFFSTIVQFTCKQGQNTEINQLTGVDAPFACFFMWFLKPWEMLYEKSRLLQAKGFSLVCESLWYFSPLNCLQGKLHWLQVNDFSPECCRMCILILPASLHE